MGVARSYAFAEAMSRPTLAPVATERMDAQAAATRAVTEFRPEAALDSTNWRATAVPEAFGREPIQAVVKRKGRLAATADPYANRCGPNRASLGRAGGLSRVSNS